MEEQHTFELTPDEVATVADMARWMRGASIIYYVAAAIVILGGFLFMLGGGILGILVIIPVAVVVMACAMWLRKAADAFQRGARDNEEMAIGFGFRELRAYFILTGILGLLQLVIQLVGLGV